MAGVTFSVLWMRTNRLVIQTEALATAQFPLRTERPPVSYMVLGSSFRRVTGGIVSTYSLLSRGTIDRHPVWRDQ
jgi:hypothetical protein